jgi:hypothetical protein
MSRILALACLALACPLAGCGDGIGDPRATSDTVVIEGDGTRDGYVRSDGMADQTGDGPGVGDLEVAMNGLAFRMFYSFDLAEIPAGATVTSVRLRVFQQGTQGDPYGNLGDVIVDHVAFGDVLDASDYAGGTLSSNIGTLMTSPLQVYMNLGVATQVQEDLAAGRARSQFRLRFPVDFNNDGGNDLVLLNDGENSRGIGNLPLLEVTYVTP